MQHDTTPNTNEAINLDAPVMMSTAEIGAINKKHRRTKEAVAEEILKHIQDGAFPPFPETPKSSIIKACDFSRFPRNNGGVNLSFLGREEIQPDFLPSWISDYCNAVSKNTVTPATMSTLLSLSVISTVLAGKAVVQGWTRSHKEELMLWTVTVLESGNLKSPVFKAMTSPILQWQEQQKKAYEQNKVRERAKADIAAKKINKLKEEAAQAEDPEPLLREIEEQQEIIDAVKPDPKLFVDKGTIEAIRNELQKYDGRMAILSAEGGIFDLICGLYNNGQADIDLFLKGFSGEYFNESRTGSQFSFHPRISIGLTVQPITLKNLASGNKGTRGQLRDRGGLGRFIFGMPRSLVGQRADIEPEEISEEIEQAYFNGIQRLLNLLPSHENTTEGKVYTPALKLSSDAMTLYKTFWREIELRHGSSETGSTDDRDLQPMQDWTAKTQGSVLRVAGNIHYCKHFEQAESKEIDAETMQAAISFYRSAIPHAQAAYALTGDSGVLVDSNACDIYLYLKDNQINSFKEADIREEGVKGLERFKSKNMSASSFSQALTVLERAGVISKSESSPTAGRPAKVRYVNPKVFTS